MGRTSSLDQQARLTVPEFVDHWARELLGPNSVVSKLRGGINNQVYVCRKGGHSFVIKGYQANALTKHDRMRAETDFLQFAQRQAPIFVPGLKAQDPERRCIVLDYVDGTPYKKGEKLSESDVDSAITFIRTINQENSGTDNLNMQQAADGFLRISEHIDHVQYRVEALQINHLPKQFQPLAIEILNILRKQWTTVKIETEHSLQRGDLANNLDEKYQCYSPSDFGFHNAIKTADGVKFIDFEFAGKDDPAKTVSDFFLQPRIPVEKEYCLKFIDGLRGCINKTELEVRTKILFNVLKIKWVCIILAVFNPDRFEGLMLTAKIENDLDFVMNRLKSANAYLLMENHFGLH